jgi:hypothetical protein
MKRDAVVRKSLKSSTVCSEMNFVSVKNKDDSMQVVTRALKIFAPYSMFLECTNQLAVASTRHMRRVDRGNSKLRSWTLSKNVHKVVYDVLLVL